MKPLLLLTALLMSITTTSSRVYAVTVDRSKALVLSGEIGGGNIAPLGDLLVQKASQGEKEVHLIISSPGGDVITGNMFITQMHDAQSRGLRIKCFVPDLAASMAFSILLQCDERYTLDNALLLWHRARVGFMFKVATGPELAYIANELEKIDNQILEVLYSKLHISKKEILYHFNSETLHTGKGLAEMDGKFLTSHKVIPGLLDLLKDPSVPRAGTAKAGVLLNPDKSNSLYLRIEYIYRRFTSN